MPITTPSVIKVRDLCFSYDGKNQVLEHINLDVNKGDYLGIIGPNGSGKTTLLKAVLGIVKPQCGEISFFEKPIHLFRDRWRVGYVPQKVTQAETRFPITVREVVSLGRVKKAGLLRQFGKADQEAVERALDMVGMKSFADNLLTELSGGQQQRVFLAGALGSESEVLILDEPTVGIDTESQAKFYELLEKLNNERGLTIIIVSHDIDVIISEVDRLVCINKTLVYHGLPKEFIKGDYLEKLYGKDRKLILHDH